MANTNPDTTRTEAAPVYRIHVYPVDPAPGKCFIEDEFETREEAIETAREWANFLYIAYADVFDPDGKRIAIYTVTGFQLVDLLKGLEPPAITPNE